MNNYNFPRVNTNVNVRRKVNVINNTIDLNTPILFTVFVADKGPVNQPQFFTSLSDFIETYGHIDYQTQGQNILNVYNFLGATPHHGHVLAIRYDDESAIKKASVVLTLGAAKLTFQSLEYGAIYNKYKITIKQKGNNNDFVFELIDEKGIIVKKLDYVTFDEQVILGSGTQTIKGNYKTKLAELTNVIEVAYDSELIFANGKVNEVEPTLLCKTHNFTGGVGGTIKGNKKLTLEEVDTLIGKFYREKAVELIGDRFLYPITIISDAAYSLETKASIIEFINNRTLPEIDRRNDITFFTDTFVLEKDSNGKDYNLIDKSAAFADRKLIYNVNGGSGLASTKEIELPNEGNVVLFPPQTTITQDPAVGKEIRVTPTYEAVYRFINNALTFGIWTNFFGATRGKFTLSKLIQPISNTRKNLLFSNKINFINKTFTEESFGGNITTGEPKTAYEEVHIAMLVKYIKRNLELIGQKYLYESNYVDSDSYERCYQECVKFLNRMAGFSIEEYFLDVYKSGPKSFNIALSQLKFVDTIYEVNLNIEVV